MCCICLRTVIKLGDIKNKNIVDIFSNRLNLIRDKFEQHFIESLRSFCYAYLNEDDKKLIDYAFDESFSNKMPKELIDNNKEQAEFIYRALNSYIDFYVEAIDTRLRHIINEEFYVEDNDSDDETES